MIRLVYLVFVAIVTTLASDLACGLAPDRIPLAEYAPPKHFTNSVGMKFVWIPPGSFIMGSPPNEEGREKSETQHRVTLTRGYYLGVYTVTQEQWQSVMSDNPSRFKGEKNLPVDEVSWEDCQRFIKKLREKDRKLYRLPYEAEWEYACRAGTSTPFHFGESLSTDQANYNGTYSYGKGKKGVNRSMPTPVGNFQPNAWGLYDMHGNVYQWCEDWFGDLPQIDAIDPKGPPSGSARVFRGGSWHKTPRLCRSATRDWLAPGTRTLGSSFRICFFME